MIPLPVAALVADAAQRLVHRVEGVQGRPQRPVDRLDGTLAEDARGVAEELDAVAQRFGVRLEPEPRIVGAEF